MLDLLFKGGVVVDGLGSPMYRADVGIQDGKIEAVGNLEDAQAERTLDCTGKCVSPGWVDIHGHADWSALKHPIGLNLLIQGCTFTVAGNCGGAPAPMLNKASDLLRGGKMRSLGSHQSMLKRHADAVWSMADYLDDLEREQPGVNYVQLAGHNQIRKCVMGDDPRKATSSEIAHMEKLVAQAIEEGAFGLSTGLVFIPGCWSDTTEIIELAKVAAQYDGLYASHIRGERETNIEATLEFIEIVEKAGIRGQMSHMQSKYPVFGNNVMKMELLTQARHRGVDVTVDSEAFPEGSAGPGSFLQIYHNSAEQLMVQLQSPKSRADIKNRMRT
ncbi:MAG: amidohydrolase family protein, partial [Anaerolineae bacterium]|nr:amidohydrolase family protein [Anaerolineae bacterium]